MTTSALIPKPNDEVSFEDNCAVLAKSVFSDPDAATFAEKGYKQYGIDILAYRDQDPSKIVGIQCKLKTKGAAPTEAEIRQELKKLEGFEHELDSYHVWHTANDSTNLEDLAVKLTKEFADSDKKTMVYIRGWRKLSELISQDTNALRAFSPDQTAATDEILQTLAGLSSADDQIVSKFSGVEEAVGRLEQKFEASNISIDGEELGAFHKVIDQYAGLLRKGKAQTALDLLRDLEKTFNSQTTGAVRFRVRANIGHALTRLGKHEEGSKALKESVEFSPNTAKAWQTRVIAEANLDNFDAALQILENGLEDFPEDPELISLFLQIASRSSDLEDPWSVVPKHLKESELIQFGVVDFYRVKKNPSWRSLAKSASTQHPESKSLLRVSAEAILDEATEKYGGQEVIPKDDELDTAAQCLQQLHDAAKVSEEKGLSNNLIIGCNLITAYRLMGRYQAAGEVADELLPFASDFPLVIESVIPAFSAQSRYKECRELIDQMPAGRDRIMLTVETYLALGEYDALLEKITDEVLKELSPEDNVRAKGALLLAREAKDSSSVTADDLDELLGIEPKTIDVLAVIAGVFARKGDKENAEKTFEEALGCISKKSSRVDRYNLARTAQQLGRWGDVIDLLSGYTVIDTQTEELRRLATAFVHTSKHPDADEFFDCLIDVHPDWTDLIRQASHQAFNKGDLGRAEKFSKRLIELDPHDAEAYVVYANILNRRNKIEEVAEFIKTINLDTLTSALNDKLAIAAICVRHGRESDGFQLAYDLTVQNMSDPAVTQFFATLVFAMEPQLAPISVAPKCAVLESCVEFRDPAGEQSILITSHQTQLAHDIVNIDDDRAQALLGATVGAIMDLPLARKKSVEIEVTAIQHPYVGLARSILRNLERRYSHGADGLYSIQAEKGDIQPVLDEIRELAETDLESSRIYTDGVVPLFVVASHVRGNVIDFAGYLAAHDREILSCVGTHEERNAAIEQVQASSRNGVTLDTYTFWVLCELSIFDAVKEYFGKVYLAQSTVDDLISYREKHQPRDDKPAMSIGYVDGEFFRDEVPAERLIAFSNLISERISIAQEQCNIVAATLPKDAETVDFEFLDRDGGHGLDAIYVAVAEASFLLSDDHRYRQLAQQLGIKRSSWLQPLLLTLLDSNVITPDEYSTSVILLADRRHRYISIRSNDLLATVTGTEPSQEFRVLAKLIGSPDAEIRSHIQVVTGFAVGLENIDLPEWAKLGHLGALIGDLIKHRKDDWREIFNALIVIFNRSGHPNLTEYVVGWARGHFLV